MEKEILKPKLLKIFGWGSGDSSSGSGGDTWGSTVGDYSGGPADTKGFSEELVNSAISQFNTDSQAADDTLNAGLNGIMNAIAEKWGTADGKKHVEDNVVPAFKTLENKVANSLKAIGKVIRSTAQQQARDTHNEVSISVPIDVTCGDIVNNVQDKLSNGYVGVYTEFEKKITEAFNTLNDNYGNAVMTLHDNLVAACSQAFTKAGTSAVAEAVDTYVAEAKNNIKTTVGGILEELVSMAQQATTYAEQIQDAGLRSTTSN